MILPTDEKCREVIRELDGDPALTRWEADFIASNLTHQTFTAPQKEAIARLLDKYEI